MIKAVLDTNILISAVFWKGPPYRILEKGIQGNYLIVTSPLILEEVKSRLISKFKFPEEDTLSFIETILFNSEIVEPKIRINIVKKDPSDNKIIECALTAEADFVVTGDKHLLDLQEYHGIKIIKPAQFLKIV